METVQENTAWPPLTPDVEVSLSDRHGINDVNIYMDEFDRRHNRAAPALCNQAVRLLKEVIEALPGIPV